MSSKHLLDLHAFDVEKRYKPSKHYVYCIWVTWSDSSKNLIYRRYSEFFDLQCKLLNKFEKEAGKYNPYERQIPFLPGKILFGRSHIKSVALDRLHPINIYCKKLITLKNEISQSDFVVNFFQVTNSDINQATKKDSIKITEQDSLNISKPIKTQEYICIHEYKSKCRNELSLRKNEKCFVIEKNLNGWWFIDSEKNGQGYIPSCVIQPLNSQQADDDNAIIRLNDNPELNIVVRDYSAQQFDELNIKKGDFVFVLEKNFNGWWKAKCKISNKIGYLPAICLQPANETNNSEPFSIPAFELFSIDRSDINDANNTPENNNYDTKNINNSNEYPNNFNNFDPWSTEVYYAIEDYTDEVGDGINLKRGKKVNVISKENSTGWWYVQTEEGTLLREGWAPSAFLDKTKPPPPPRPAPPVQPRSQIPSVLPVMPIKKKELHTEPLVKQTPQIISNQENETFQPVKVSNLKKLFEQK